MIEVIIAGLLMTDLVTGGAISRANERSYQQTRQIRPRRTPIYVGGTFSSVQTREEHNDPMPIVNNSHSTIPEQFDNQTRISLATFEQQRIRQSEEAEAAQREERRRRHEEQRDAMITQQLHNVIDRMAEIRVRLPRRY